MKITGYKLDKYIEQLDRAIGDANYPKGDDLMGMSILRIETDAVSGVMRLFLSSSPLAKGEVGQLIFYKF